MALTIPEPHKPVLKAISELDDGTVTQLITALQAASPSISARALAETISSEVDLPIARLASVISVLLSLTKTRRHYRKSPEELAIDVTRSAEEAEIGDLKAGSVESGVLTDRLSRLLQPNQCLDVTARASEVFHAHSQSVTSSRVLSDIRTIFESEDSLEPVAGMIVHTLELGVTSEEAERASYFAMNIHDLQELQRTVERAIAKHGRLQRLVEAGGLIHIEDSTSRANPSK